MNDSPPSLPRLMIVDDEDDMRWVLRRLFEDAGFEVDDAADGATALERRARFDPDVVLSDVRMPRMNGFDFMQAVRREAPDLPVVLLSAVEDIATAVDAVRAGAWDYQAKPFDDQRLLRTVRSAAEQSRLRREVERLRQAQGSDVDFGPSAAAQQLERTLDLVAPQESISVLILGESGTGKEVVARSIHRRSPRAHGPFVAVDCGALPESLMESQLFGHRKGAFTGADRDRPGLFRMADGGTLFLDELGNLPAGLQAKLLRALQERKVVPVGGGSPEPFDARLVCATNNELRREIEDGTFRMDLFHRVAEFELRVPALRERTDDIPHFARVFLAEANGEMGRSVRGLTEDAEAALIAEPWPGNLRQLRNAIRRAVLLAASKEIGIEDLDVRPDGSAADVTAPKLPLPLASDASLSLAERVRQAADAVEAQLLAQALAEADGNKAAAARSLQIDYTTLHRKLKRHGIR